MAKKVKVSVTASFGDYRAGDSIDIDEARIPYLERKGLIKRGKASEEESADVPFKGSEDWHRSLQAVQEIAHHAGIPLTDQTSLVDSLEEIVQMYRDHAAQGEDTELDDESGPESGHGAGVPPEARSWRETVAGELGEAVADALDAKDFGSADLIQLASDEELDAVKGVGPTTIEKLRTLVDAYIA